MSNRFKNYKEIFNLIWSTQHTWESGVTVRAPEIDNLKYSAYWEIFRDE